MRDEHHLCATHTNRTPAFLNTAVVFNANFSTTQDLYACSVTVNNNAEVVVTHIGDPLLDIGHTLTVKHEVTVTNGATLKFDDDTSLVQIEGDVNSGDIIYERITPKIINLDYVYWSSPVAGQTLFNLSPGTNVNRYYEWSPNLNNWVYTPPLSTIMQTGKGYIVRGPSGFTFPQPFTGRFVGIPNNGTITTPVLNSVSKANLIGNPYPSALDIDCFLADPANAHLGGTIRLWTHNIPIDFSGHTPGGEAFNYNVNSYIPYNRLGGVGSGITAINMVTLDGIPLPIFETDRSKGKVAAGQSFFIDANSSGVATFKNNMRAGSQNQENGQFFRNANIPAGESSPCVSEDRHRLWMQIRNLSTLPNQFKQTLMGYTENATNSNATTTDNLDRDYDFKVFDTSHPTTVNLYSLHPNNTKLIIQGRALAQPFDTSDLIPLGFSCQNMGGVNNTIEIRASEFDGLFLTTDFWLRINQGGGVYSYHDIKTTPYTFEIGVGGDVLEDTTTFAIVFSNPLPRNAQTKKEAFKVVASPNTFENSVTFEVITAEQSPINVQIFDLLGKLVEQGDFSVEGIKDHLFGTQLSTGVYQAIITQGNQKSKHIKKIFLLLAFTPFLLAMTCDDDDEVYCTQESKAALNVSVSLGAMSSITSEGVTVVATDGNYSETLVVVNENDPIFSGAYEREGNYIIIVSKEGYQTYSTESITVTRDVCHVIPQQIHVVLVPN
jgi:hypothetical protein